MARVFFWMLLVAFMSCSSRKATVTQHPLSNTGSETRLPTKEKLEEEVKKKKHPRLPRFENDFKVALMLPFFLKKDYSNVNSTDFQYMSLVTDYYEGWLLALDSLKKSGINLKLYVYDTQNDSLQTVRLLQKPEFAEMDMIFGPLDKASFETVIQYGKKNQIAVVSPFSNLTLQTAKSPYAFYCTPDLPAYGYRLANFINTSDKPANVVYVSDGKATDLSFFKAFDDSLATERYRLRKVSSSATMEILPLLEKKDSTINYIVVASDDELTASNAIKSLKKVTDHRIVLVGLDTWKSFKNQDFVYWNRLNLHLVANYHFDDSSQYARNFWFKYKERFKADPSEYAVKGFDHGLFFGQALLAFGKYFPGYVLDTEFEQLHNNVFWHFNGSGVVNRSLNILEFKDFRLRKIQRN